jgi:hypothetical protein
MPTWMVLLLAGAIAWIGATPAAAQQTTFATPQEAAQALVEAATRNDTAAMLKLFGPAGKDIVESGDAAEDKRMREGFVALVHTKMQIEPEPGNPGWATMVVGADDWPFPVPLVLKDGKWHFDALRGRMQILARRIGRNELSAIDVCRGYVEAQMAYASHDHDGDGNLEYAQKIISMPGKKDGLYWEGESENLVPKSFADAAAAVVQGGDKMPTPYHGYYFHVLKAQGPDAPGGAMNYVVKGEMIGGFALVAWPAEYGVSGIKTLLVSHQGTVYEKDLGATTATLARAMTRFNPDKTWIAVEGE